MGTNYQFLSAETELHSIQTISASNQEIKLTLFSQNYLESLEYYQPQMLRSRSKISVVLHEVIRRLHQRIVFAKDTGTYLFSLPGPFYKSAFARIQHLPLENKLNTIQKKLPPKQYFIQNVSMQAARVALDFQLHGPWIAFTSQTHGFDQAWDQAIQDIQDGVVSSALVCGAFSVEEPIELIPYFSHSSELIEACVALYLDADSSAQSPIASSLGKYGALSGFINAINNRA